MEKCQCLQIHREDIESAGFVHRNVSPSPLKGSLLIVSRNDILMKYPSDMGQTKALTYPKPDWLLGVTLDHLDPKLFTSGIMSPSPTANIVFPMTAINRALKVANDFSDFCCGIGHCFGLPQFVLERKSMSGGSLFSCQNQLIGALWAVVGAMKVVENRLQKGLNTVAFGVVNVGNYMELWCLFEYDRTV